MVRLIKRTREGIGNGGCMGVKGRGKDIWADVTGKVGPSQPKEKSSTE
jgi:hypothetical protein